ncbi:MAG: hypothetical protein ACYTBJ_18710 [Planctomycetota bacterium]|jgi:hypothetical protein
MTYDFATLNATLTGANVSEATRRNREFATDEEMYTALLHCFQHGPIRIGHGVALRAAQNAGLLKLAPLTEQQERTRARNSNAKLSRKVVINAEGLRYLQDLDREINTPKPVSTRALAVVKATCSAVVVAGHWERLGAVDMINQARDAMYTVCLRERANTYSMIAGMAI